MFRKKKAIILGKCEGCKGKLKGKYSIRFCGRKCYFKWYQGKNHLNWKGGTKTRPDGYIRDSKTDKYIHRIVMEKFLRRKLLTSENIHHIDGNPKNNDISNLIILSNSEHRKVEVKKQKRNKYGIFTK